MQESRSAKHLHSNGAGRPGRKTWGNPHSVPPQKPGGLACYYEIGGLPGREEGTR
nr:MAG TPA: hypothetical protein [Caudoviricetes sp.]